MELWRACEAPNRPSSRVRAPSELERRARLWVDAPNGEWRADRQAAAFEAPRLASEPEDRRDT
jgi:hypothetical protein